MKYINKFGYSKIEILIIVVLLGIVAFITINKTSYAFAIDNSKSLSETQKLIELRAEEYALDHLDLFAESNTAFITVSDLIEAKYLIGNDVGLFTDPTDSSKNFNDNKLKLEYDGEKKEVDATLIF